MKAVQVLAPSVGIAPACRALGLARASFYRQCRPQQGKATGATSSRALSEAERHEVLSSLNSERFRDKAPAQVYARLLDEGVYLCSISTMYRLLAEQSEVKERRNQLRHPQYQKPELLATAPNQVWSWDITKLLGPVKWSYFYLYVILDIYSRYLVGWMLASCEGAALAQRLIQETCDKQEIAPTQLTIHADRGAAMTSKPEAFLLADLGITKSHSRPHTSNDNPYSEAQFKTLKYRPDFPERFDSMEAAHTFCQTFFPWYNCQHYHSGIGLLTPESVHYGCAQAVSAERQKTLLSAYQTHPERFVNKLPQPPALPTAAWINPPKLTGSQEVLQ